MIRQILLITSNYFSRCRITVTRAHPYPHASSLTPFLSLFFLSLYFIHIITYYARTGVRFFIVHLYATPPFLPLMISGRKIEAKYVYSTYHWLTLRSQDSHKQKISRRYFERNVSRRFARLTRLLQYHGCAILPAVL